MRKKLFVFENKKLEIYVVLSFSCGMFYLQKVFWNVKYLFVIIYFILELMKIIEEY